MIHEDILFVFGHPTSDSNDPDTLYAIDTHSGKALWHYSPVFSYLQPINPLYTEDSLIIINGEELVALDLSDGTLKWSVAGELRINDFSRR